MEETANKKAFAEVIESSLTQCTGQTWQWDHFPEYGSLVCIRLAEKIFFGIVTHVNTGSPDNGRTPFIYKKTEKELQREHPHIFAFLQTTFSCALVAFQDQARLFYQTPPTPIKIHSFIEKPSEQEQRLFFTRHDYLFSLHALGHLTNDELLNALIRQQHQLGTLTKEHLFNCIDTLMLLDGDNYRRARTLIERSGSLIQKHYQ